MNYPTTVTNPLLKKHQMPPELKKQQHEMSKMDSLPRKLKNCDDESTLMCGICLFLFSG